MEAAKNLPRAANELTPEWLTSALARSYPGVEVTSVHFGSVTHGTATKVRLLLSYNEAGHSYRLPATMLAKCNFEAHSSLVAECARSEAVFYRDRAPGVQHLVNAPKCYFAGLDEKSGDAFLLLEDLLARNVTFGFAPRPKDARIAQLALEMLARYHAHWWNSPGPVRVGPAGSSVVTDVWLAERNFERSKKLPRFQYVPPEMRNADTFRNAVIRLWEDNTKGPTCLLHGDLHLGNCFFEPDGSPGFLDWQGDTHGCWAHDFTEFVLSALEVEDRRKHERPLLELYLKELRACGVDAPSFENAWQKYRRNTLWIATAAVCPSTSQDEAVCTVHTQRAMAAVTDLDALASFDE
jgi:hypothetical protein